jgi:trigger factor
MQVEIEAQSPVSTKVTVTIPAADVGRAFQQQYARLSRQVKMPGFRAGRIPAGVLRKRYGAQVTSDVTQELVQQGWEHALDAHQIKPVGEPDFDLKPPKEKGEWSFSATVEVMPPFDLPAYDSFSVEQTEWNIPEDRVEHELEHIAEAFASWEPVEGRDVAEQGDTVIFDYAGSIDGVAFDGGTAEGAELELGGGRFIPGFEEQIVGKKKGDAFDVEVTFPEEYPAEHLAGKPAVFACTLHELKAKKIPAIDDALASQAGQENLDALKADVRARMSQHWESESKREAMDGLRESIAKAVDFEVPPKLAEAMLGDEKAEALQAATRGGASVDAAKEDVEGRMEELQTKVADEIRTTFLLDRIGDQENFEVDEREVAQLIDSMSRAMGPQAILFMQYYRDPARRRALRRRMRRDKVLEFLLTKATVTKVAKDIPAHDHGDHDHDH